MNLLDELNFLTAKLHKPKLSALPRIPTLEQILNYNKHVLCAGPMFTNMNTGAYRGGAGCTITKLYDHTTGSGTRELGASYEDAEGVQILTGHSGIGGCIRTIRYHCAKSGSPTGTIYAGVRDDGGSVLQETGYDVATKLGGSLADVDFDIGADHTISADDRVGLWYSGGDSSNFVTIGIENTTMPSNTEWFVFDGGTYTDGTSKSPRMTFDPNG